MGTVTKPNTFSNGETITAEQHNQNYDAIFNEFNGSTDGDNIASGLVLTGDFTVDTNTLFVDSGNNRVGIGTITPVDALDVHGEVNVVSTTVGARIVDFTGPASFTGDVIFMAVSTAGTGYDFAQYQSSGGNDRYRIRSDGEVTADGSFTGGGADYAEMFEWEDGNPSGQDRRGWSVSLVGEKIKKAGVGDTIIGVISATPTVVGNAENLKYHKKYVRDDFGAYVLENNDVKIDPGYDKNKPYAPRKDRKEWDAVGMMGRLRVLKGEQTDARWIKLKDISATVEEWLVR